MTQQDCTHETCLLAQVAESDPIDLRQALNRERFLRGEFGGAILALS